MGVDDAPFARTHRGDVLVVATVFSGQRLEGVLSGCVRRDGDDATRALDELVARSRFARHVQAVLLQGIALAGFNVIDIHELAGRLGRPVLVVARRQPDLAAVRRALIEHVPGGPHKWALIERAGPMEPAGGVFVQRARIGRAEAVALVSQLQIHGKLPEPLRVAHLIAGGVTTGESSGRA